MSAYSASSELTAAEVIGLLGLVPHPEGGHYRETFRDPATSGSRPASTAIYFLLAENEQSAWHRIDAAELWHWYAGAPLLLRLHGPAGPEQHRLGPVLRSGERPQAVVPAHWWQSARTLGSWTLAGCTVAPGFSFAAFELLAPGADPHGPGSVPG